MFNFAKLVYTKAIILSFSLAPSDRSSNFPLLIRAEHHPTEHFTISEPWHPSSEVSDLRKVRLSPDFKASKQWDIRSGNEEPMEIVQTPQFSGNKPIHAATLIPPFLGCEERSHHDWRNCIEQTDPFPSPSISLQWQHTFIETLFIPAIVKWQYPGNLAVNKLACPEAAKKEMFWR